MKKLLAIIVLAGTSTLAFGATGLRTVDGDTVNVPVAIVKNMPDRLSVRLIGINAPETKTAKCKAERDAGEAAKLYVSDRLARATEVKVEFIKWDKYGGRFDGKVTVDGKDLATEMLAAGMATPYDGGKRVNVWCPTK